MKRNNPLSYLNRTMLGLPINDVQLFDTPIPADSEIAKYLPKLNSFEDVMNKPKEKDLSELIDYDTFLRFGYVPFVIAEVVWDYADTCIDLAIIMGITETKVLSRKIRELRRDYVSYKARYLDSAHLDSEQENMEVFIESMSDYFNRLFFSYKNDVMKLYPELTDESKQLVAEVYLCRLVIKALYKYVSMITRKVEKLVGHSVGSILPTHISQLSQLVIEFVGDSPLTEEVLKKQEMFVDALVNHINSIELSEDGKDIPRIIS